MDEQRTFYPSPSFIQFYVRQQLTADLLGAELKASVKRFTNDQMVISFTPQPGFAEPKDSKILSLDDELLREVLSFNILFRFWEILRTPVSTSKEVKTIEKFIAAEIIDVYRYMKSQKSDPEITRLNNLLL